MEAEEKAKALDSSEEREELQYSDQTVEKAPVASLTFVAESDSTTESHVQENKENSETTEKSIVVVQKSEGLTQEQRTLTNVRYPDPLSESNQYLSNSADISSKTEAARSITGTNKVSNNVDNNVLGKENLAAKYDVTTQAPVVTSTTEENEAKVEDVQFFSAPLVTAFTVHQDERGIPKSIIPLYKQQVPQEILASQFRSNSFGNKDLYRKQLLEKQKQLELQLQQLQEQQKKQQEFLLKQQVLLQQQPKREAALQEQLRIQKNQEPFKPITAQNNIPNISLNQQLPSQHIKNQFSPNQLPSQQTVNFNNVQTIKSQELTPNQDNKIAQIGFNNQNSFTQQSNFNNPSQNGFNKVGQFINQGQGSKVGPNHLNQFGQNNLNQATQNNFNQIGINDFNHPSHHNFNSLNNLAQNNFNQLSQSSFTQFSQKNNFNQVRSNFFLLK